MSGVIVLNTDNTALHTVSVQHAIRMLVREVAIVEEAHADRKIGPYPWPLVLRLIRYVKTTFLYARSPAWSKRGVLRRDHHTLRLLLRPRGHRRPPAAPVPRRPEHLAQHRRRLHPVQQPQGQPDPGRGAHAAGLEAAKSRPGARPTIDETETGREAPRRGRGREALVGRRTAAVEGQADPQRHRLLGRLLPDRHLRPGAAAVPPGADQRQPLPAGRARRLADLGGDHRGAVPRPASGSGRSGCCSAPSARSSSTGSTGGPASSGAAG